MVKGYKFGILYCTKGQKRENDFFQNRMLIGASFTSSKLLPEKPGPNYMEFLEWIGTTIPLKGWDRYNAGLDVESMCEAWFPIDSV